MVLSNKLRKKFKMTIEITQIDSFLRREKTNFWKKQNEIFSKIFHQVRKRKDKVVLLKRIQKKLWKFLWTFWKIFKGSELKNNFEMKRNQKKINLLCYQTCKNDELSKMRNIRIRHLKTNQSLLQLNLWIILQR